MAIRQIECCDIYPDRTRNLRKVKVSLAYVDAEGVVTETLIDETLTMCPSAQERALRFFAKAIQPAGGGAA